MRKTTRGYTTVELLIVICAIGVLAVIVVLSFFAIQSESRNNQRLAKITVIAAYMEKYYDQNGEYPICLGTMNLPTATSVTSQTLKGMDPNALTTPTDSKGDNSVICDDISSGPGDDVFSFVVSGGKWKLKYREEGSGRIVSIDLRRDVIVVLNKYTLTINTTVGGTVSAGGIYDEGTIRTISAISNSNYIFSEWTGDSGCIGDGTSSHTITVDKNITCTAHFTSIFIPAPSAPVVIASTPNNKTDWSWTTANGACTVGSIISYQYRYVIDYNPRYTSSWYQTDNLSTKLTTSSEGYEYIIQVQARCSSTYYTSDWSLSGVKNYIRPVQPIDNPGTTITFALSRYSASPADTAQITATSSCTNGAYVWSRADMAVTYPYSWYDTGRSGFWADSHGGVWKDDDWGHTDPATIRARDVSGSLYVPSSYRMAVEIRCQNADTGRYSVSTGRIESSWLVLR